MTDEPKIDSRLTEISLHFTHEAELARLRATYGTDDPDEIEKRILDQLETLGISRAEAEALARLPSDP